MFVYNLTAYLGWSMIAWCLRIIMLLNYKRTMLLITGVTLALVWYDYHEMRLVLYALFGWI